MIYVMSDIHGNMKNYGSIMEQINLTDDDELYVLGDVIDRHEYGIQILKDIMDRPNIHMLLGNHEHMMLEALDKDYLDDTRPYYWDDPLQTWFYNGGLVTLNRFKTLRESEQTNMLNYLKRLPLSYDIEVNGTPYRLVHACPVELIDNSELLEYGNETRASVWIRIKDVFEPLPTVIFGHSHTNNYQIKFPMEVYFDIDKIGIDCGSGLPSYREDGRLACIRLDDMKVFYSN